MRYPVSKNTNLGIEKYKKLWEPVGICLINSTTNPAQLGWKWAELPLRMGRQIPSGYHDFFFLESLEVKTIETYAFTFLSHFFGFSWFGDLFFLSEEDRPFIFIKKCCMKLNSNLSTSKKSNGQNNGLLLFAPFFSVYFPFCVLNR